MSRRASSEKAPEEKPKPTPWPAVGVEALPEYSEASARDPIDVGSGVLDRELEAFLRSLNQRMGWIYPSEFSHIPMSAYRAMVQLCIFKRAAPDLSVEEQASRLSMTAPVVGELLAAPGFAEVAHAFEAAWDQVAQPKTLAEHIADPLMQHKIAQRTIRLALHAGDTRVASKTLEQINDRAMPAVKQPSETRVLMLTPEIAALIADTMRLAQARPVKELSAPEQE